MATPSTWEAISRKWKDERVWRGCNLAEEITLCIFDQLHLLSSEYEVIVSRTRIMLSDQTDLKTRLVGLACPIANGRDVAMWMGISMDQKDGTYFNFLPSVRSQQLETSV